MIKFLLGVLIIKFENLKNHCIYSVFKKKYKINNTFRFNGNGILFYGDGEIHIGENSYIGELSTIQAVKGNKVKIGKNCQISHNVRVYTSTDIADQDFSLKNRLVKNADVIIGDFVWIGANVFINPGVEIEDNSIIGANSVVTKSVKANTIVGGVPARIIRQKSYK
ncbi:acyltransferase [Flavobacterium sp. SOK18b]|nr:acyltransferase [Flavobacterium sp. SOK18b]MBB1194695.1 acyltransferase [Flavobacterium sp. SOK18b]